MTMTLVSTVTVGAGGTSEILFSGIPQSATDLVVVASLRSNTSSDKYIYLKLNGTSTGLTGRNLYKYSASSVYSGTDASIGWGADPSNFTANTFGSVQLYIPNYSGSTNKSMSAEWTNENNASDNDLGISALLWSNTAAITSLGLSLSGTIVQYSTASLYTITKGSGGATVS